MGKSCWEDAFIRLLEEKVRYERYMANMQMLYEENKMTDHPIELGELEFKLSDLEARNNFDGTDEWYINHFNALLRERLGKCEMAWVKFAEGNPAQITPHAMRNIDGCLGVGVYLVLAKEPK